MNSSLEVPPTRGAFYCLVRVRTALSPMAVAERLIREHRVAVIPGCTFGLESGCHLRVAFGALEPHTVEDGMERLVGGIARIVG